MMAKTIQARRPRKRRQPSQGKDWERYEQLKQDLAAKATPPAEYDAACRRAAELAGV